MHSHRAAAARYGNIYLKQERAAALALPLRATAVAATALARHGPPVTRCASRFTLQHANESAAAATLPGHWSGSLQTIVAKLCDL